MQNIEITNINLLNDEEKKDAEKIFSEYYNKIKRQIKNQEITLKVEINEYEKGGKRKKYSLIAKMYFAKNIFKAEAHDWDFARTAHKAMGKLITEIEHRLHVSEQH